MDTKSRRKQLWIRYILSFMLPIGLILMVFIFLNTYPFGDNTLMISDMKDQYIDYFSYLTGVFKGENNLLYTFSKNLGGDMIGLTAYYLISPLNIILLFFRQENLPIAAMIIILLKIGFSGLSCCYFLNEREKDTKGILIFSTSYALMAYSVAYCYDIMWLDSVALFPLMVLGIHRIVEERRVGLYMTSLSISLITNYYIGYMLCIFSVIYFIYQILLKKGTEKKLRDFKRQIGVYIGGSIAAAGLAAFVLIPTFLSLQGGKASFTLDNLAFKTNYNFFDVFAKLFTGAFNWMEIQVGLPNIFCGMVMLVLAVLYFLNKEIDKREKKLSAGVLGVMLLSFFINTFNIIWHGFNAPIWFPYRYSFMFSFLMVYFGYRCFKNIKGLDFKRVIIVLFALLGCAVAVILSKYDFINIKVLLIDIGLIFSVGVLIYLLQARQKRSKLIVWGLLIIQFANISYNAYYSLDKLQEAASTTLPEYQEYIGQIEPVVERVKELDDSFYRMEKNFRRTLNDSMQFSYNGLTHFSSSEKSFVKQFMGSLGYRDTTLFAHYRNGTTVAAESLVGMKYLLADAKRTKRDYELVDTVNDIEIYKNPYALPIGFGISEEALHVETIGRVNKFDNLNRIYRSLTDDTKNIFARQRVADTSYENVRVEKNGSVYNYHKVNKNKNGKVHFQVKTNSTDQLFLYMSSSRRQNGVNVYVNGRWVSQYFNYYVWDVLNLGSFAVGDTITVTVEFTGDTLYLANTYFYYEDLEVLEGYTNQLKETTCELEKVSSSHLKGTVNVTDGEISYIMLTIPYEDDWKIKVDGKTVKAEQALGALIAIPISSGEHEIEMWYEPAGLKLGIAVSSVCFLMLIAYVIYRYGKKRKAAENE